MSKQASKSGKTSVIGRMLRNTGIPVAVAVGLAAFPGATAKANTIVIDCCDKSSNESVVPVSDMRASIMLSNLIAGQTTLTIQNNSNIPGDYNISEIYFDSTATRLNLASTPAGYSGSSVLPQSDTLFGITYEYALYTGMESGQSIAGIPEGQSATFTITYTGGNGVDPTTALSVGFDSGNDALIYGEDTPYARTAEPATFLLIGSALVLIGLIRKSKKDKV